MLGFSKRLKLPYVGSDRTDTNSIAPLTMHFQRSKRTLDSQAKKRFQCTQEETVLLGILILFIPLPLLRALSFTCKYTLSFYKGYKIGLRKRRYRLLGKHLLLNATISDGHGKCWSLELCQSCAAKKQTNKQTNNNNNKNKQNQIVQGLSYLDIQGHPTRIQFKTT